jgi:uncharacterized protein YecE (DUF72 family)
MIRIGPAGWSYKDWYGKVYPAPKPRGFDELAYLARYFDTVEVNSSFYAPMRAAQTSAWIERTAHNPRFLFTAKLLGRFTHERDTAWTRDEVAAVRDPLHPLLAANKLGALLAQFPWSFRRTGQNRAWLARLTDEFADLPLVVEIRHASWNTPEFFDSLRERGVGFVNIDQPPSTGIEPTERVTAPVAYIRLHGRNLDSWFRADAGVNERYDYLYSAEELTPWRERALHLERESRQVFVITNNHFEGKAVANAAMLKAGIEGEPVPVPPNLFDAYPDVLQELTRPL